MPATDSFTTPPALLLVGHGTRDLQGQEEFAALAELVARAASHTQVVSCCLELTPPSIAEGVAELARRGVRRFVVVPVLLLAGGHARTDIPAAVREAVAAHPGMTFEQAAHLGCQEALLRLSANRFRAARRVPAAGQPGEANPASATATYAVMIGRGGSDEDARDEMRRFVDLRMRLTPVGGVTLGFLAGNGPSMGEALEVAERAGLPSIVVQPHLLFQGRLVQEVARQTQERARRRPDLAWHLAEHLGPAAEIAAILMENYGS